jgi:membrane-bound serine protease (ClpP class)
MGAMLKKLFVFVTVAAAVSTAIPVMATSVARFEFDDTVQAASSAFTIRAIDLANERGAELVVIELDTPGGFVTSSEEIIQAITTSKAPVAIYVSPAGAKAASAGFYFLMAADVAAMAPGTSTGAATPIALSFSQQQESENFKKALKKTENALRADLRSFAQHRGRNQELIEKTVTESVAFSAEEALEGGVIDLVVGSFDELLEALDGREVHRFDGRVQVLDLEDPDVFFIEPTPSERFRSVLATPILVLILMALAGLGIYTEITHPGGILPGVVGVIALLLFLYASFLLPLNWLGVGLIVLSLVLFALEVKVASYGLLTIGGLICFVSGSMILFDAPIPEMRLSLGMVLPTALLVAAIVAFLVSRVLKAHQQRPFSGKEGLIDEIGTALSALAPDGKVKVHGEYWDARSSGEEISEGSRVRVVAVTDRRVTVEPAED